MKLCQLAENNALKIVSTAFQHKNIHKGTWKAPGGEVTNQIDHVLINRRRRSNILDVRIYRGANGDSDHYLVRVKIRRKISSSVIIREVKRDKWNAEELGKREVIEEYQEEIRTQLMRTCNNESVEEEWRSIKDVITEASGQIIGKKQYRYNEEWFDQKCIEAINEKNEARRKMI